MDGVHISDYKVAGGRSTPDQVAREADALQAAARAWVADRVERTLSAQPGRPTAADRIAARVAARESSALFSAMRAQFSDLLGGYPLACQFIVKSDRYDPAVFRRYLATLAGTEWKDRQAWLASQADYAAALYRHERPRESAKAVAEYRRRALQSLTDDDEDFKEASAYAEEEVARIEKAEGVSRRARMQRALLRQKAAELGAPVDAVAAAFGVLKAARLGGTDALRLGAVALADDPAALDALRALSR